MIFATADLCDNHEHLINAGQLRIVTPMFRCFGRRTAFYGQIATIKLFEDNSFVRAALQQEGNGRVLVIDGGGSLRRAVVGDQLATLAVNNGWSGIVVYGCIRDSAAIASMDIGVLALATHPQKTDKKNIGEADIPVSFGNATFRPGEWLYADGDGVLVASQPLTE